MAFSWLVKYREYKSEIFSEFYTHISSLLENEKVQQLDDFIQHYGYTRLKHSIDVAYYSFFITKLFGWDSRSAARAGLLHDLFLYDWREEQTEKSHAAWHPLVALENARSICTLNKVEEDIIKKHMWLLTPIPPRYKEGFVVTFVDKFCATREFFYGMSHRENVKTVFASNI